MRDKTKIELLESIKNILDSTDAAVSWDLLPNRYRIKEALKYINTLIALEE